jgi:hypothetical protein
MATLGQAALTLNKQSMSDPVTETNVQASSSRTSHRSCPRTDYTKYFTVNSDISDSEDESSVERIVRASSEETTDQSECDSSDGESSTDQSRYSSDSGFVIDTFDSHESDSYCPSEDDSISNGSWEFGCHSPDDLADLPQIEPMMPQESLKNYATSLPARRLIHHNSGCNLTSIMEEKNEEGSSAVQAEAQSTDKHL